MLYPRISSADDVRVLTHTHIVSYQPRENLDPDTPCIEVTQTTDTDITLNEAKRLRNALDGGCRLEWINQGVKLQE